MRELQLAEGAVLWRQGEPCSTLAIVEKGRLGVIVRSRGLIGVATRGTVVGEASVLGLLGHDSRREADVVALDDDTSVTELPAVFLRDSFGVGLHRKVLRSLHAQISRGAVGALDAVKEHPAAAAMLGRLADATAVDESSIRQVRDWDEFTVLFRILLRWRAAMDELLHEATLP